MTVDSLGSAPGVDTICIFPKNAARLVPAGQETDSLVGLHNDGDFALNIIAIKASLRISYDHHILVQNLTIKSGSFDLVGILMYEIDQHFYQSVFYNGTIEVVEAGDFLTIESVFLVTLALSLISLLALWAYGRIQHLSKKTKRAPKVEVGTATTKEDLNEWLQGTSYAYSQSKKNK